MQLRGKVQKHLITGVAAQGASNGFENTRATAAIRRVHTLKRSHTQTRASHTQLHNIVA